MKMNTDRNLHFQIAGPGPTAFKLWIEETALRDENLVVVIFYCGPALPHQSWQAKIHLCSLVCLHDSTRLLSCN